MTILRCFNQDNPPIPRRSEHNLHR